MKISSFDAQNRQTRAGYLGTHLLVSIVALVLLNLVVTDVAPAPGWLVASLQGPDRDFAGLLADAPAPFIQPLPAAAKPVTNAPR